MFDAIDTFAGPSACLIAYMRKYVYIHISKVVQIQWYLHLYSNICK